MEQQQQFDNTNKGAIFVNDRKVSDTHADRTGSINVDGVDYFINGWLKESKAGAKFMSLSVKRKDVQSAPAALTPNQPERQARRPTAPAAAASYGSAGDWPANDF